MSIARGTNRQRVEKKKGKEFSDLGFGYFFVHFVAVAWYLQKRTTKKSTWRTGFATPSRRYDTKDTLSLIPHTSIFFRMYPCNPSKELIIKIQNWKVYCVVWHIFQDLDPFYFFIIFNGLFF